MILKIYFLALYRNCTMFINDISFSVKQGEVVGLIGSNGAGKSTLMKILSGVYKKDGGEIFYKGKIYTVI